MKDEYRHFTDAELYDLKTLIEKADPLTENYEYYLRIRDIYSKVTEMIKEK